MKELTALQKLYARYESKGLVVIGISVDDEAKLVLDCATGRGARYPIVWDEAHRVAERYRPETDPSTYVIDREGIVRFYFRGYHLDEERDYERALQSVIGK